jgi:hypothetical protein
MEMVDAVGLERWRQRPWCSGRHFDSLGGGSLVVVLRVGGTNQLLGTIGKREPLVEGAPLAREELGSTAMLGRGLRQDDFDLRRESSLSRPLALDDWALVVPSVRSREQGIPEGRGEVVEGAVRRTIGGGTDQRQVSMAISISESKAG